MKELENWDPRLHTRWRLILFIVIVICGYFLIQRYFANRFDLEAHNQSYLIFEKEVDNQRDIFSNKYNEIPHKERYKLRRDIEEYLMISLRDSLFNYWEGTKWDYNGITERPREGKIACGYFVSTSLQDLGYNLNRRKMAQQASSKIVNAFCSQIKRFSGNDLKAFQNYLEESEDGMFILGLDKHVGFISKEGNEFYFIHSGIPFVRKEHVVDASSVMKSNVHYIGRLFSGQKHIENG